MLHCSNHSNSCYTALIFAAPATLLYYGTHYIFSYCSKQNLRLTQKQKQHQLLQQQQSALDRIDKTHVAPAADTATPAADAAAPAADTAAPAAAAGASGGKEYPRLRSAAELT